MTVFLANAADATIDVKVEVTEMMGSETYLYLTTTGKEGNIIARVNPRTTSIAGAEYQGGVRREPPALLRQGNRPHHSGVRCCSRADQGHQSDEVIHFTQNFQEALSP